MKKNKATDIYTISYLVRHPQTREIILKYLAPILDEQELIANQRTLREMFPLNMASGNAFMVVQALMKELDAIEVPLKALVEYKDSKLHENLSFTQLPKGSSIS